MIPWARCFRTNYFGMCKVLESVLRVVGGLDMRIKPW